jgi:tetratricopeptide (TPR) repeat protein
MRMFKPPISTALLVLGLTACATGGMTTGESVTRLEQQQKSTPTSAAVNRSLGIAYYKAARYPDARTALETATRLDPKDGTTALYLGLSDEELGDLAAAKAAYSSYITYGRTSRRRRRESLRLCRFDFRGRTRRCVHSSVALPSSSPRTSRARRS